MDDAPVVGHLHGVRHLASDGQRFVNREGPGGDALGQGLALDQLEDKAADALGFFQAIDGRDVRVVERSEELRLAAEAGHAVGVAGEGLGQDFEGDVAVQAVVAGPVDFTHAALAELLGNPIMGNGSTDQGKTPRAMVGASLGREPTQVNEREGVGVMLRRKAEILRLPALSADRQRRQASLRMTTGIENRDDERKGASRLADKNVCPTKKLKSRSLASLRITTEKGNTARAEPLPYRSVETASRLGSRGSAAPTSRATGRTGAAVCCKRDRALRAWQTLRLRSGQARMSAPQKS